MAPDDFEPPDRHTFTGAILRVVPDPEPVAAEPQDPERYVTTSSGEQFPLHRNPDGSYSTGPIPAAEVTFVDPPEPAAAGEAVDDAG